MAAPFSEQSVLLFHVGVCQEENKKGRRLFWNGSSILAYDLLIRELDLNLELLLLEKGKWLIAFQQNA